MNESRNRSIRKFNPGTLQSDEEVIRQFLVRNHQLDAVLETLRDNIDSPSCQHVLIVAPRGRGKSITRFEGLDDATQPFFELFRIIDLKPLNTEECRRLWQMVSGDGASEHEIRPLEILTGGSPRLLVIVGEFARHQSVRQLMEELVKLIDDHTEYFRGHLESFAKSERRVYLAVIDLWQPSRTGEIAARARMDVRTVSALLGRLVGHGREGGDP